MLDPAAGMSDRIILFNLKVCFTGGLILDMPGQCPV